jgi:hypothetical protein
MRLAQHAACVMPGARSPWADAMRRELDYIEDDSAAMRWALGCVFASYRSRLAHRPLFGAHFTWRHVAASGVLMLLVGLALQERADGQTEPPRPALDEAICGRLAVDPPGVSSGVSPQIAPSGPVVRRNRDNANADPLRSDCPDRHPPNRPDAQPDR